MSAQRPDDSGYASRFLIYFGFVLTGMVTVQLGPLLPLLSEQWHLNDARTGYLFAAQFLGSMLGVALTSWLLPRFGFRPPLVVAYFLMSAGVFSLGSASWNLGLTGIFGYGVGIGVGIPASNLWTGAISSSKRASALSLLNAAWGLGAVLCAPGLALSLRGSGYLHFLFVLAAILILTAISFAALPTVSIVREGTSQAVSGVSESRLRTETLIVLGCLFFLYVGTENAIGGWVSVYTARLGGSGATLSTLAPSFFWAVLLLGRLSAPFLLNRIAESKLAVASLILASLGTIVLLGATKFAVVVAGTCLAGLGLAAVYPITIAHLSRLGLLGTRLSGLMFALAGLGGATIPSLVGIVSSRYGGLKTGLAVPVTGAFLMMILYAFAPRWQEGDNPGKTVQRF